MKGKKLTDTTKLRGQNKDPKQHRNQMMKNSWRWQYRGMKKMTERGGLSSKATADKGKRNDMHVGNSMTEKERKRWSRRLYMVARKEENWKTLKEKLRNSTVLHHTVVLPVTAPKCNFSFTSSFFWIAQIWSKSQFCALNTTGNMIFLKFTNLFLYCVNTLFNLHCSLLIIYMFSRLLRLHFSAIPKCYSTEPANNK